MNKTNIDYYISNYQNLKNAPYDIKNNKDIIFSAAMLNYNAFKYASESLRDDKEFVLYCLNNRDGVSCDVLKYLSDRLKNDKDIAFAAINRASVDLIREEYFDLKNISESLRGDKEVMLKALEKMNYNDYEDLYWLVPDQLKSDKDILNFITNIDPEFRF